MRVTNMAKSKKRKKSKPDTIGKGEIFLYLIRITSVTIVSLFLWISCITFDPGDWPNQNSYPHNDPLFNWCGPTGSWISYNLFHLLGQGTWVLLLFAAIWGLLIISGSKMKGAWLRVTGMLLLITVSSSILSLVQPAWHGGLPEGTGGVIGLGTVSYLQTYFSKFGTALILLLGLAIGLILAADELVIYFPAFFKRTISVIRAAGRTLAENYLVPDKYQPKPKPVKVLPAPAEVSESVVDEQDDLPEDIPQPLERVEPKIHVSRPLEEKNTKTTSAGNVQKFDDWELPPREFLKSETHSLPEDHEEQVRSKARILERTLSEFRIEAVVVEIDTGPVVTMFELQLGPGIKVKSISERSKDLARALKSPSVRVVAPIPGKNTIGVEVPNLEKHPVRLSEIMDLSGSVPNKMDIPLFLGKDAGGGPIVHDLATMPPLLIAGTTGSGKSVCINSIIMSILLTQKPDTVKMILVDPKMVELSNFKDVPHLMCPLVHDADKAEAILEWMVQKMDERYSILAEAQVRNLHAYNRLGREKLLEKFKPADEEEASRIPTTLPYIVFIIDELADLMMVSPKEVELYLARLAQKSRAVGIHMILATQRPEAKVVTGLIKSNLPARIAFRVNSRLDARIVMDQNGAEDLLGAGDMLFLPPGSGKPFRAQGTLVDEGELKKVLEFICAQAEPEFSNELMQIGKADLSGIERDEAFDDAVRVVLETKRGSVSLLQRKLNVGYSRASRLIEQMATAGIVGDYKGSQAREVTMTLDEYESLRRQMQQEVAEGMTD